MLVGELVDHFGVNLNAKPGLEREGVTPATTAQPSRLIIVGASHTTSHD
jgi:hypothetical protein